MNAPLRDNSLQVWLVNGRRRGARFKFPYGTVSACPSSRFIVAARGLNGRSAAMSPLDAAGFAARTRGWRPLAARKRCKGGRRRGPHLTFLVEPKGRLSSRP